MSEMADDSRSTERRMPGALERPVLTFSAQAVDVLREMVLSGQLHSGERINEVELAGALGISRGPLREAIQRLRSEGLLTAISGRGSFVRTFTPKSLKDLYEVRIALETHAVRLVGKQSTPEAIAALQELLDDTKELLKSADSYPEDHDFHLGIVDLSNNPALKGTAVEVLRQIHLARSRSAKNRERAQKAFSEHQQVLEALVNGKVERAAKLLATHLHNSLDSALLILESERSETP